MISLRAVGSIVCLDLGWASSVCAGRFMVWGLQFALHGKAPFSRIYLLSGRSALPAYKRHLSTSST